MDISSVTGQSNIGGISQPIIGQRKIEHEIRLKEGEVNSWAACWKTRTSSSLNGIRGWRRFPILKYLFSSETKDHTRKRIVFALIPHVSCAGRT